MNIGIWLRLFSIVYACGVAIHLELVDRILPLLPNRIAQHYNYIRSGAFYPDAFYNCMGQYDVAEDAHWPPFLARGIDLVRERKERGQDTSQFEAFLVGILSHQVSDVSWHSLGIFQGLLRAMAENEFDGDYEKAHSVLDIGGDMIQLNSHTIRETRSTKWEFKTADILDLLSVNGYNNISTFSIRYCMARGHAAYSAELRVAGIGHKRYARKSPMVYDKLESYFAGGLTDMHEQIEECIPELFNWLENGVTGSPWSICQVFSGAQYEHTRPLVTTIEPEDIESLHDHDSDEEYDHGRSVASDGTHGHTHGHDISRRASLLSSHNVGKVLEILKDMLNEGKSKALVTCHEKYVSSQYLKTPASIEASPSRVGSGLLPLFGQSLTFWGSRLVVGAPNEGQVYVYSNNKSSNPDFGVLETVISSNQEPKQRGKFATRFGSSLATWKDYLVVASPGTSQLDLFDVNGKWSGGIQWENVTTRYGGRGLKLLGEDLVVDNATNSMYIGAPYVDIVSEKTRFDEVVSEAQDTLDDGIDRRYDQIGMVFKLQSDILEDAVRSGQYEVLDPSNYLLYKGEYHYEHAGMSLAVSPNHILVGAPGKGRVYGFDRKSGKRTLNLDGSALNSEKPSGFGGYMLGGTKDSVIVGSPAGSMPSEVTRKGSTNQEGVVSVFKNSMVRHIPGKSDLEWFGSNGVIVGSDLYVVSPHAHGDKGQLWKFNLLSPGTPLFVGNFKDSFASGLGSAIVSNGDVIAIGMPHYGQETGELRRGAVAILPVSPSK